MVALRKSFAVLLSLVTAIVPAQAFAATDGVGDVSDAMRYGASAPIGSIITNLSGDDDSTDSFQAPFEVNFFGTVYGGLCVTTNGGVFLTQDTDSDGVWTDESCSNDYDIDLENLALAAEAPMIAAMGNDQDLGACNDNTDDGFGVPCEMYYGTTTVGGRDAFVVTWYRVQMYEDNNASTLSNTYQIVIIKSPDWNGSSNYDFDIEFNFGQVKDIEDGDGYDVNDPTSECSDSADDCRWAIGWVDYDPDTDTADPYELFADTPSADLEDGAATALTSNSLNSSVLGRYAFGMRSGVTVGFEAPTLGSGVSIVSGYTPPDAVSSSSGTSSNGSEDPGVPGIFLTVTGRIGDQVNDSPVIYGSNRVAQTSIYRLTLEPRAGTTGSVVVLAEGTIEQDGSFDATAQLPALSAGNYKIVFTGRHALGYPLRLTNHIVVGAESEYVFISDEALQPVLQ